MIDNIVLRKIFKNWGVKWGVSKNTQKMSKMQQKHVKNLKKRAKKAIFLPPTSHFKWGVKRYSNKKKIIKEIVIIIKK